MPFIRAVQLETFRSSSLTFNGVPRYSSASFDLQDGTTIPKETIVISNAYHIMHDPSYWKDPQNFSPDRFLDHTGSFKHDERVILFGLGKRYCPGQSLAEKEFYLFFATILQKFKIEPAPGNALPDHAIANTPVTGTARSPPKHCLRMTARN